ncbi:DUF1845 domain-containing protein [Robbsia andropogonis]|uniref:DUF1845 domain-containing protein n=1 Tax=Robbsia andropogonis TaxID=28092 RepID=UPI002A69E2D5|nr:DUF1845 domain-containing protein [Robbsia andropogonis]
MYSESPESSNPPAGIPTFSSPGIAGMMPPDEGASGLPEIQRLSGDSRLARITPHSHVTHTIGYCSRFAREFIRSDYNFCASKLTLARGGKLRAIEASFKSTEEWINKTLDWLSTRTSRTMAMTYDRIELNIPHPLAGRLIRLLNEYDTIFERSASAVFSDMLDGESRNNILRNAERRIGKIHLVCQPDNDRFDFDGTLFEE